MPTLSPRKSAAAVVSGLLLFSCGIERTPDGNPLAVSGGDTMLLADFDAGALPKNKAGDQSFSQYRGEGGFASLGLKREAGPEGGVLQLEVTAGTLYLQFNSHNANGTRGFVREYTAFPKQWRFSTYNRLSFYMLAPPEAPPLELDGRASLQVGTYVKRVKNPDRRSDEAGGGHYYHHFNIPNTGTWTKVILNPHPHHERGSLGNDEQGVLDHPTGEEAYNYFDAMTRFYVNETRETAPQLPLRYLFDRFEFYREARPENDAQVYSLAATHVPAENRYILTWSRRKDENAVKHEVRWSREDIHESGWDAATPAPDGVVAPPGWQGYNAMVYQTTAIPEGGRIYFAVRPEGSALFSQISLP